jgi:hypothetical protein
MIVILASRYDAHARRLKDRWARVGAHLLTCEDLSVSGWRYPVAHPGNSYAVISRLEVKQSDITGVLTRLPWVWESELADIRAADRAFVAAEMSAFLVCWLSGLRCPILNRPMANCLSGPGWSGEQWNVAASRAGMRTSPLRRGATVKPASVARAEVIPGREDVFVTVVGKHCFGVANETLKEQALRLANLAGVDFLAVQFSSEEPNTFIGVNTFPDIEDDVIADAVLSYLERP